MTNTAIDFLAITDRSAFLDALDHHLAFSPFQTSSSEEGFEFNVLVTAEEHKTFMEALYPIIEANEAEMRMEFNTRPGGEYGHLSVDVRGSWVVEVGRALIRVYDGVNAAG